MQARRPSARRHRSEPPAPAPAPAPPAPAPTAGHKGTLTTRSRRRSTSARQTARRGSSALKARRTIRRVSRESARWTCCSRPPSRLAQAVARPALASSPHRWCMRPTRRCLASPPRPLGTASTLLLRRLAGLGRPRTAHTPPQHRRGEAVCPSKAPPAHPFTGLATAERMRAAAARRGACPTRERSTSPSRARHPSTPRSLRRPTCLRASGGKTRRVRGSPRSAPAA
mmetsp:Transcript_19637/g.75382  ORF Transcript_19637/g.75382 Transcript_19637/m.75382 type:complete len:227 (-) Transcript_19637:1558-2238(-)